MRKNTEQKIVEQHSDDAIIIIQSPAVFALLVALVLDYKSCRIKNMRAKRA